MLRMLTVSLFLAAFTVPALAADTKPMTAPMTGDQKPAETKPMAHKRMARNYRGGACFNAPYQSAAWNDCVAKMGQDAATRERAVR